ncbi:MAG: hypothetical protein VX911_06580 [Candidatus Latescibacterota bacterium]|nr:hypothetical protein [Candidatus Latescibacterota bacterium]
MLSVAPWSFHRERPREPLSGPRPRIPSFAAGLLLMWAASGPAFSVSGPAATIIDRDGHRHDVTQLALQDRQDMEIYVDEVRQIVLLADVDRIEISGDRGGEEMRVALHMRTGHRLAATMFSGAGSISPHQDTFGRGDGLVRFDGVTELGRFSIPLSDVAQVILRHTGAVSPEHILRATVVDMQGGRFEVSGLRYRRSTRFSYSQGQARRAKEMAKIGELEFGDAGLGESRLVTITFWSGKKVQGTVDASTARLSGETDRMFEERLRFAFTGETKSGPFNIGLRSAKLVRFHKEEPDAVDPKQSLEKSAEKTEVRE